MGELIGQLPGDIGRISSEMAEITSLPIAVRHLVKDGAAIALEGFTHLIPFAAGHEVIRQRRRDLTIIRMTPDLIYDQMIGMGCAARIVFSWAGNPGVGSLHRFRDAVENGWPHLVETEEHSHADMAARYQAGAAGLPFAVIRGYIGSDLPKFNPKIAYITCPFTGEALAATPALRPDVTILHAQKADKRGNALFRGIVGVQKEAALAAKSVIVTVEEIVSDLNTSPNDYVLPGWVITFVCHVPHGTPPSYAHGYYDRDNAFYKQWDTISRDREHFLKWMQHNVLDRDVSAGTGDSKASANG